MDPDGFQPFFLKQFWHTIKNDVTKTIYHFFNTASLSFNCKRTYITLIPKTSYPELVTNYWSISLCNTTYKIIAKILVHRLQPILPHIILQEQGAFIQGWFVMDQILLSQELMHSLLRALPSHSLMIMKFDMEKVYDCVS